MAVATTAVLLLASCSSGEGDSDVAVDRQSEQSPSHRRTGPSHTPSTGATASVSPGASSTKGGKARGPRGKASGSASPRGGRDGSARPSPGGNGAPPRTQAPPPKPSSPESKAPGKFPDASNTGVPPGVQLSPYDGPMTITRAGTVVDARRINGLLVVRARDVEVRRSHVTGRILVEASGSLKLSDSFVDGGRSEEGAVGRTNLTMRRVEVVGARVSVHCEDHCDVQDSWLHDQYMPPNSSWHVDGYLTNGGDDVVIKHNTLACDVVATDTGACSAALAAYGDFSPITNLTVENNLFKQSPAGYCLYGGHDPHKPYGAGARNVRITGNVFERGRNGKCGVYGAATAVAPGGPGNEFTGNVWSDGAPVRRP